MLKREENELVTRVGPGTQMGDVMRHYWMPALLLLAGSPLPNDQTLTVEQGEILPHPESV